MSLTGALRLHLPPAGAGRPAFRLDLPLTAYAGEVVALLGPNGAGKSTALRALAGLHPLTGGRVEVDGETWEDVATGVRCPPDRRQVGMVFQDLLLFPHLSALDNVAFGLRARGRSKAEARDRAARWLDRVGLADHHGARPATLSGGQAQRVALARALATEPRVLLLDEPLSALDAGTRPRIRAELQAHLRAYDGVAVVVTHDALDALVLADRIVVVENGTLTQQGTPADVARRPRTDYVARLVGLNLYRGDAAGTLVRLPAGGQLTVARPARGAVHVAFRPASVALFAAPPTGSPRNSWQVTVRGVEDRSGVVRVQLDGAPPVLADVTAAAVGELGLHPGQRLWASIKATEIETYLA